MHMGKALIIAEKPSVASDITKALGGFKKHDDYFESEEYVVSSAVGHLLELTAPLDVVFALCGRVAARFCSASDGLGGALGFCVVMSIRFSGLRSHTRCAYGPMEPYAIRDGEPMDTTMGMTPAGGLMMGARTGDLDPGALVHLLRYGGYDAEARAASILKDAGIEGTANLWFFIGAAGDVQKVQVNASSGYPALDQAALRVAGEMEFEPAELDGDPVPVWVALDLTFDLPDGKPAPPPPDAEARRAELERERRVMQERMARESMPPGPPSASAAEIADQPTFTPMTVRPQLRNAKQLQELLMAHYPTSLRDAGIGGTVNTWFLIDETGRVVKTAVNESSGSEELDAAALEIASRMEFTPAYNRDDAVPVWVALDITFEVMQ